MENTVEYYRCNNCSLIFQDPKTYLDNVEEKKRYDTHQNNPDDPGYRKFLSQVTGPVLERISEGDCGLDFGCGPGPTISVMLEEKGYSVQNYDLYYANHPKLLEVEYDFITSTEVFEHLYDPKEVLDKLWKIVKPGGILVVMTVFYPHERDKFKGWWYKNDPTHVCFYNEEVFEYIAKKLGAEIEIMNRQVVILKKIGS